MASTLMHISRAQRDSGEHGKALDTLEQAENMLLRSHLDKGSPEYGSILSMKAELFREKEAFADAEKASLAALAVLTEAFGTDENPEIAVTVNGLGSIYHDQQRFQDALVQYQRSLQINLKTVGINNPETAASYNNLGNVYQDAGDDDSARTYYYKTLEIQRATIGEKNPDVSATLNNIASIDFRQKQYAESVELFRKAA